MYNITLLITMLLFSRIFAWLIFLKHALPMHLTLKKDSEYMDY